jgi:hypothetical protein
VSGGGLSNEQALSGTLLWFDSHDALHELIHLALRQSVDDEALAKAIDPSLENVPFPTGGTQAEINHWVFRWSNVFDTELRKHCKPTRAPYFPP